MSEANDWQAWEDRPKVTPETPETPVDHGKTPAQDPDLGESPQIDEETPETPEVDDPELKTQEVLERFLRRWERTFLPPDIVRKDRPSLLKVISYAFSGDWGPREGVIRVAGKIDAAVLGVPGVALFYALAWWWERPARRWGLIILISLATFTATHLGWI